MTRFIVIFCVIIFSSCSSRKSDGVLIYNRYKALDKEVWESERIYDYNFVIQDTSKHFDISLSLKHNNTYEYKNLYLFLKTMNKYGQSYDDTLNLILQSVDGMWLGNEFLGVWEYNKVFLKDAKFRQPGNYTIVIKQAMRNDTGIKGVEKIGISVVEKK